MLTPPSETNLGLTLDLLTHLERALKWTESQALDALGDYLLSTEPGRRLQGELDAARGRARAA